MQNAVVPGFKVVVRCRPLNRREVDSAQHSIVAVDENAMQISVQNPSGSDAEPKIFNFDRVFGPSTSQADFFSQSAKPVIDGVLAGTNGTIFSYGQTGAGKTWAIQGVPNDAQDCGFLTRATDCIFSHISADPSRTYTVSLSFLEIYNEEIYDLLVEGKPGRGLRIKQQQDRGIFVEGLTSQVVTKRSELHEEIERGTQRRHIRQTMMSALSSRSHLFASITVESKGKQDDSVRCSKLTLVDLAGSERLAKTGCTAMGLREGMEINRSLTSLGNCISALASNAKHVPFRDSKLTRLLQESLGGVSNTLMTCHVSPAAWNHDETISTLRYAHRAKHIQNKPKLLPVPAATPACADAPAASPKMSGDAQSGPQAIRPETDKAAGDGMLPTQQDQATQATPEGWVVVLPQAMATRAVAEMVEQLEAEGVTAMAPAAFLQRFEAFVAATGAPEDDWETL